MRFVQEHVFISKYYSVLLGEPGTFAEVKLICPSIFRMGLRMNSLYFCSCIKGQIPVNVLLGVLRSFHLQQNARTRNRSFASPGPAEEPWSVGASPFFVF